MSDMSIGGAGSSLGDQLFGARVVSKTLDTLNNTSGMTAVPTDRQTFGAAVVGKTLDTMNANPPGGASDAGYGFQKDVLGAAASKAIVDNIV